MVVPSRYAHVRADDCKWEVLVELTLGMALWCIVFCQLLPELGVAFLREVNSLLVLVTTPPVEQSSHHPDKCMDQLLRIANVSCECQASTHTHTHTRYLLLVIPSMLVNTHTHTHTHSVQWRRGCLWLIVACFCGRHILTKCSISQTIADKGLTGYVKHGYLILSLLDIVTSNLSPYLSLLSFAEFSHEIAKRRGNRCVFDSLFVCSHRQSPGGIKCLGKFKFLYI